MAKILIVEDDRELLNVIKSWLTGEQYSVEAASNGTEGLDLLRFYQFDLVILDLHLPGIRGLEILKPFRNSRGNTPVLILTGKHNTATDKEIGLDTGADDY